MARAIGFFYALSVALTDYVTSLIDCLTEEIQINNQSAKFLKQTLERTRIAQIKTAAYPGKVANIVRATL